MKLNILTAFFCIRVLGSSRLLWGMVLCLLMVVVSCKRQDLTFPSDSREEIRDRVERLTKAGNRLMGSDKDSLKIIADSLLLLGKQLSDSAVLLQGQLFALNNAWRNSNYVVAMQLALKALSNAQKLHLTGKIPQIYSTIGNLYKENEDYPSAIEAGKKGIEVARQMNDTAALILGYLNLGMFTHSYSMRRNDRSLEKESLQIYLKGLKLAESNDRYEIDRIPYYDNLSQYYKLTGEYDKGLYYGRKGMNLAYRLHQNLSLTYSLNWLGEIFFYKGKEELGLSYLNKALRIAREIPNAYRIMEIHGSLYECYNALRDYSRALKHLQRSMDIKDSLQVELNVHQIGLMHIQYETGRKDERIASLNTLNKEKNKENFFILCGLLVVILLAVFLFFQYRTIRKRNHLLDVQNKHIQEQSERLQLLMSELHHRVKNNLQIVSSLLSLQSNHLEDQQARRAMQIGQQRIEAMSLIHRSLYQRSNPNMVDMREYISDLLESIFQSFGFDKDDFDLDIRVEAEELDVDLAMPIGLIVNEWVTNALKYAYADVQRPQLFLSLEKGNALRLQIKDNGPGMPIEAWEKPRSSFGVKLVKVLCKQLKGDCRMTYEKGTVFRLIISGEHLKNAV